MRHSTSRRIAARELGAFTILLFGLLSLTQAATAQSLAAEDTSSDAAAGAVSAPADTEVSAGTQIAATGRTEIAEISNTAVLPDAPGEMLVTNAASTAASGFISSSAGSPAAYASDSSAPRTPLIHRRPIAPLYNKYIEPGQTAQVLTGRDKIIFGFRQEATIYFPLGAAVSAGYSHLTNGSPNYGTNADAYAQRLGAALARNASQNIFSDSFLAPILHEDPRYYVMGNRRGGFARAGYAISRVLLTRSEGGDTTPNFSLLGGYAGAAGLTNAYYPQTNRGFTETAKTFGGSLGGAALSNVVREFLPDLLHAAHLE